MASQRSASIVLDYAKPVKPLLWYHYPIIGTLWRAMLVGAAMSPWLVVVRFALLSDSVVKELGIYVSGFCGTGRAWANTELFQNEPALAIVAWIATALVWKWPQHKRVARTGATTATLVWLVTLILATTWPWA